MTELEMQHEIAKILEQKGYMVYLEVPFLSRSIDIVAVKNERIYAYELKLSDWRKAIYQSSDHLHGVDMSIVCLPRKTRLNEEFLELLQEKGLGLMLYDKDTEVIEEIVPAPLSEHVWPPARNWLTTAIGAMT